MESLNTEILVVMIAVGAYFFAAIPFGLVLSKFAGLGDIRNIGSGNIGATNVLRTGNKKIAALTLFFDVLKGMMVVLVSAHFIPGHEYALGFLAIFAHIFPIYLKFKGGKGVATALGVYFAWSPFLGLSVLVTWLITAKIFRISSLSALVAALCAPFFTYFLGVNAEAIPFTVLIAAVLLYTHRENIKRIFNKQEPFIS
ncbi:MAG: glycerol-3-phosphate 1-O-acyltransferase PlsY [Pseudomonadota bacterium]|jgi:glycerol-3-phosphate acyltransferase PlsY|nr:glycerol-3-phosphate 1-O-acyltransferase PlsY [Alphaproteobacteria bacterium]